ncbi:PAS domain S-box protein [Rhodoferax sp. 4810]|nr:PAS domain S-box protein [Rhodoferax jenense]
MKLTAPAPHQLVPNTACDAENGPQAPAADLSPEAMRRTIHELRVHQIELEIQNDELRRMQAELDTAQARYFDFYDLAPAGYVTVDDNHLILQANLATASLLGVTRSALIRKKITRFISPADQDVFYLLRKQIAASGAAQSCELCLLKAGGQPVWTKLQAIAVTSESGQPVLRMVLSDITERKALEAQLVRDKAQLRTILDGASDAIFINDSQGRFLFVNQRAVQMLGFDEVELLGMSVADITLPEDAGEVRQKLAELMTQGSLRYEPTLRRKDGSTVKTELSGAVLADGSGFAACRDITERLQLQAMQLERAVEAELTTSRQRLRELVAINEATLEEERKHIAREVHDELGQVLTALRMNLSLLDMPHGRLDTHLKAEVQGMKDLVDRAIQGVRNVATRLRPTALDMGLVPAIGWLCQEFARLNGLPCKLDAPANLDLDMTRAVVVFRIVQESLTNITRYAAASQVHVVLRLCGGELSLQVADNGCGFDLGQVEQRNTFGLLGMRERAIALGGRLQVASSPGHGTTVDLAIPFCAALPGVAA